MKPADSSNDFDLRATQEMATGRLSDYSRAELAGHEDPPDDPNASRYDNLEGRVVHREERAANNQRGNRTVIIAAILIPVLLVAALIGAYALGNQREATLAASTTPQTTRLVYVSPSVTIWVQRVNPAHHEVDFSIIVASTDAHHVTRVYTFLMSDDPPADGRTYVLHCKYNGRFFLVAANLILDHPMTGTVFNGGATLYLTLGRQGKYLLRTP